MPDFDVWQKTDCAKCIQSREAKETDYNLQWNNMQDKKALLHAHKGMNKPLHLCVWLAAADQDQSRCPEIPLRPEKEKIPVANFLFFPLICAVNIKRREADFLKGRLIASILIARNSPRS